VPVARGTVVVSGGSADRSSRILQRSRSVTSSYRRSVSPSGRPRPQLQPSGPSIDRDPGLPHRLTVMLPPPPVITYSGASRCCTPTGDQEERSSDNQASPTWAHEERLSRFSTRSLKCVLAETAPLIENLSVSSLKQRLSSLFLVSGIIIHFKMVQLILNLQDRRKTFVQLVQFFYWTVDF